VSCDIDTAPLFKGVLLVAKAEGESFKAERESFNVVITTLFNFVAIDFI